ncbi:GHKL domain-containing protein [Lactobacillus sp. DCY120]|uniref:GHKL domain-containing protein n=1 Tax=Bombilactobacillus apium TaxID=2675299 RepID=A0A850R5M4_9LACO|nr:GHKL domain-containing protein [Bombilactobacillus apium]NVY96147.1 GHKL domain-containing protein [Bombilactobacillus apium]
MYLILFCYISVYLICLQLLQINFSPKEYLYLSLISGTILALIIYLINIFNFNGSLVGLFSLEFFLIAGYLKIRKRLFKNIFFLLLGFLVLIFTAQLIEVLVNQIFSISYAIQESDWRLITVNTLLLIVLAPLITQAFNYLCRKFNIYSLLHNSIFNSLVMSAGVLFLIIVFFSQILVFNNNNEVITSTSLLFFLLLIIVGLMALLWLQSQRKEAQLAYEKINNQQLIEYVTSIEQNQLELRKFKHDYLNVLAGLTGYLEAKDWDGLEHYFYRVVQNQNLAQTRTVFNLQILSNMKIMEIKGLLALKLSTLVSNYQNINLEIFAPISKLPNSMPIYEYNRCLGILLDNALEAIDFAKIASTDQQKYLTIIFYWKNRQLIAVVKNRYSGSVDLTKINTNGFSSKGGHEGLGLASLNDIVKKNNKCLLKTEIDKEFFTQKLILMPED